MFHLHRTMQNIHHELQSQTDVLRSMRDQRVDRNRSPPPHRRNVNNTRPGNFYMDQWRVLIGDSELLGVDLFTVLLTVNLGKLFLGIGLGVDVRIYYYVDAFEDMYIDYNYLCGNLYIYNCMCMFQWLINCMFMLIKSCFYIYVLLIPFNCCDFSWGHESFLNGG